MTWIVDSVRGLVQMMSEVASSGPITGLLLTIGAVLTVGSVLVIAYLAAGAVVDLLVPDSVNRPDESRR